jgi:CDP-diacylglycerol--glycerol-3-phosphate 3-phosphatidyltransferase
MKQFAEAIYDEFFKQYECRHALSETLTTVPNYVTAVGISAAGVYVVSVLSAPHHWWPLIAFAAIVVSDMLDGALARRRNEHTWFGRYLDAVRDALLRLTALWAAATVLTPLLWYTFAAAALAEGYGLVSLWNNYRARRYCSHTPLRRMLAVGAALFALATVVLVHTPLPTGTALYTALALALTSIAIALPSQLEPSR